MGKWSEKVNRSEKVNTSFLVTSVWDMLAYKNVLRKVIVFFYNAVHNSKLKVLSASRQRWNVLVWWSHTHERASAGVWLQAYAKFCSAGM